MSQALDYESTFINCPDCGDTITVTFVLEYDTKTGETNRDMIPVKCDSCRYTVEEVDIA